MSTTISSSTDALSDQLLAESFPDLEPSNVYIYSETEEINDELSDILLNYLKENQSSYHKEPTEINIEEHSFTGLSPPTPEESVGDDALSRVTVSPIEAPPKEKTRKLDPIDPELVARVKSKHLLNLIEDCYKNKEIPNWAEELRLLFDEQAPISNWCAHKGNKWDRKIQHICRPGYAKLIESLAGSILEKTKKEQFFSAPGRVTVFTVPKEEEKLRLIANCIELNKLESTGLQGCYSPQCPNCS